MEHDRDADVAKTKATWETPRIESKEVFEKTALACSYVVFDNTLLNFKTSSYSCGFNAS